MTTCYLYSYVESDIFSTLLPPPPRSTLFPYTTLFRSRKAVLPSECHHPAQELEIICGQNLLCLGATEEFHIAARLLLHGIGTQQPGKDGWMRCIDDDQPAQHVGVRNGERPSDVAAPIVCHQSKFLVGRNFTGEGPNILDDVPDLVCR